MMIRLLARDEIEQIWTIDRREVVDNIYYLQNGKLALKPDYFDIPGWPPGEAEQYMPRLYACFDRGGVFYGAFDQQRLVGVVVVDSVLLGPQRDQLELKMLHVSRDYRKHGLGVLLFEKAREVARACGAKRLYISATPSENTIHFYQRRGAIVTPYPDPELLALEPDDIHLECPV
ncbi:MAG: GNAT family N-acetyltransferase [Roseiflexaceae bacterium]